VGTRRGK